MKPSNEDILLGEANQRFVSLENCYSCAHSRPDPRYQCDYCCYHPKLDSEQRWPLVEEAWICDWYTKEIEDARED